MMQRRPLARTGPVAAFLAVVCAACGLIAASPDPLSGPTRARAFIATFDRVLIAGFVADRVPDRDHELDLNAETARLLRLRLRARTSIDVVESPPVHLPHGKLATASAEDEVFGDVAFWRRLGEEYRQPLILTGTVDFRRAGSQSIERQIGPRAITVWRPRFKLRMRLVFICGRTGQILESVPLGPVTLQAPDERTSALGLYFQMMDRLTPDVLAIFGDRASASDRLR